MDSRMPVTRHRRWMLVGVLVAVAVVTGWASMHREGAQPAELTYHAEDILGWAEGAPLLRAGTFSVPSLFDPTLVSPDSPKLGKTAATTMLPEEPVLGVEINGDVRAYSTWFMNSREIIHDVVGGEALLLTW